MHGTQRKSKVDKDTDTLNDKKDPHEVAREDQRKKQNKKIYMYIYIYIYVYHTWTYPI